MLGHCQCYYLVDTYDVFTDFHKLNDTLITSTEMAASDLDCGDVAVVVRFVIPEGRTEVTVTEALSQAFEQSKEAGLAPVWVQEQEVLNLSPTKTVTFIHGDLVSHCS